MAWAQLGQRAVQHRVRGELSLGSQWSGPLLLRVQPDRQGGHQLRHPAVQPRHDTWSASTTYAIPKGGVTPATAASLVPGTANCCDPAKYQDILPRVRHTNVAFTFDQKLGDRISLFADGTYSKRTFLFQGAAPTGPLQVPSSNAFFVAPPGTSPSAETVNYSFAQ